MNVASGERSVSIACLAPILLTSVSPIPRHVGKVGTHKSCRACHARSAKTIENDVARLCVVKQISHYRFIGDFSVITVRHIKWVVFPFANISSKWFTLIGIADFFIGCSVLSNEFLDERIRTRRVVRRAESSMMASSVAMGNPSISRTLSMSALVSFLCSMVYPPSFTQT